MTNPVEPSRLAAVVLAAGASSRMGTAKARLTWQGRPFLAHVVALARAARAAPIVVVQGAVQLDGLDGLEEPQTHDTPERTKATLVTNADWPLGPLSSLQTGLRAVLAGCSEGRDRTGLVVLSVDRPHVAPATLATLAEIHTRHPTDVVAPSYRGEHGHPIVLPSALFARVLALAPTQSLRELLRGLPHADRRFVEVEDPAVVDNLDRPEDLARLRGWQDERRD